MNDYLLSLVLGIVEGLTEFLPVSSTAHLRISEALLHISLSDGYWKMYTIVIQLGRDPVPASIFSRPHCQVHIDLPARRAWGPKRSDSSFGSHHGGFRRHRDSGFSAD